MKGFCDRKKCYWGLLSEIQEICVEKKMLLALVWEKKDERLLWQKKMLLGLSMWDPRNLCRKIMLLALVWEKVGWKAFATEKNAFGT